MSDEMKPVRCGCGGKAEIGKKYLMGNLPDVYVICGNCSIRTGEYYSEAEAIEAWNKAMGVKERTAKVTAFDKDSKGYCLTDGRCEVARAILRENTTIVFHAVPDWSGNE